MPSTKEERIEKLKTLLNRKTKVQNAILVAEDRHLDKKNNNRTKGELEIELKTLESKLKRKKLGRGKIKKQIKKLKKANLSGVFAMKINLSNSDLTEANLSLVQLFMPNLSKANLTKANFNAEVKQEEVNPRISKEMIESKRVRICGKGLKGEITKLEGAILDGTDLSNVDLRYARMNNVSVKETTFGRNTDLEAASIVGVDLSKAKSLNEIRTEGVIIDESQKALLEKLGVKVKAIISPVAPIKQELKEQNPESLSFREKLMKLNGLLCESKAGRSPGQ